MRRKLEALFLRHFPGQVTCGEFERFIIEYCEGGLTERQRRIFEFHMGFCPMCRVHFEGYRKTIEMGRRVFTDTSEPLQAPQELINAVLTAHTGGGKHDA
jgi:hypothetical protein